jgi:mannose-1-phosphate guanylyltransferase
MFCFRKCLLEEVKKYTPEVYEKSKILFGKIIKDNLDLALSLEIPSISIDYAVMERSKR